MKEFQKSNLKLPPLADIYVVDNTSDFVFENANEGTDAVQSSVSYTLLQPVLGDCLQASNDAVFEVGRMA